jgi:hypothetical protein
MSPFSPVAAADFREGYTESGARKMSRTMKEGNEKVGYAVGGREHGLPAEARAELGGNRAPLPVALIFTTEGGRGANAPYG